MNTTFLYQYLKERIENYGVLRAAGGNVVVVKMKHREVD
jgi:hypothetical protein